MGHNNQPVDIDQGMVLEKRLLSRVDRQEGRMGEVGAVEEGEEEEAGAERSMLVDKEVHRTEHKLVHMDSSLLSVP